jgi:hypothetical protein
MDLFFTQMDAYLIESKHTSNLIGNMQASQ